MQFLKFTPTHSRLAGCCCWLGISSFNSGNVSVLFLYNFDSTKPHNKGSDEVGSHILAGHFQYQNIMQPGFYLFYKEYIVWLCLLFKFNFANIVFDVVVK